MEENKYYTPQIEEFFIGFEFEILQKEEYIKTKFLTNSEFGFDDVDDLINISRVKYLDKEDIEEILGVKQLKGDEVELNFQVWKDDSNDFYEIDYDTDINMLIIEKFIETRVNNYNSFTLFRGKVKNKSELQKLLKQLGV